MKTSLQNKVSTGTLLDVFPLEIWELILNQIDDTNDVLNLLETCPQLKQLTHGKQFSWLIGQVMPLIVSKFLRNNDIVACRLVSKTWKSAIASALENHPDHQPYISQNHPSTTFTQQHFMYHSRPRIYTSFPRFMNSDWATSTTTSCEINPFLGRNVIIRVNSARGGERGYRRPEVNLTQALPLFEKFGHHIWHVNFDFSGSDSDKTLFHSKVIPEAFQCLSHLPNLKSLRIESYGLRTMFDSSSEDFSLVEDTLAPFKAKINTLDMKELTEVPQTFHDTLIKLWVNHDQVKQLKIHAEYWKKAYGTLFPNLTELWVTLGQSRNDPELGEILREMKCPHLKKLRVYFNQYDVNDLLREVEPYQIEVLEIGGNYFEDYLFEEGVLMPSVRNCRVYATPYAKFNFLKAFPNLEYLTVDVSHVDDPPPYDFSDDDDEEEENEETKTKKQIFCKCLRDYVEEDSVGPYNFDSIWNDLPSLKVLTVYSGQYVRGYLGRTFKSYNEAPIHNFYS